MRKVKTKFFSIIKNSVFEGENKIGRFCNVNNSYFGYKTYVGSECKIINTKIGKYTSIGSGVKIIFGRHPTSVYVSTHPCFYSNKVNPNIINSNFKEIIYLDNFNKYCVFIGNDVWIANGATILDGVKIGDGAIIAANALVTKDVKPYSIVAGVPAKIIKHRFNSEEINFLLKLTWWNKDKNWFLKYSQYFYNIKTLKEQIEG